MLIVPWRIRFHIGDTDKLIKSQAYNHVWAVWRRGASRMERSSLTLPIFLTSTIGPGQGQWVFLTIPFRAYEQGASGPASGAVYAGARCGYW